MREGREGPRMEMVEKSPDFEQTRQRVQEVYQQLKDFLAEAKNDPAVQEAMTPAARTAINTMIAVADTIPGVGNLASWGADAAKLWARYEHQKKRSEVEAAGGDPESVKLSPVDLSPDVPSWVALSANTLDIAGAGFVPTHGIETLGQLYHDWPKLRDAAIQLREIYRKHAGISPEEQAAADVLEVEFEEVTSTQV